MSIDTLIQQLRGLTNFPAIIAYLRDELAWPIEAENIAELDAYVFDYALDELGIDPKNAVKINRVRQLRNLAAAQPWGIFYVEFESKKLPVMALRRILRALVRVNEQRPAWKLSDLLFICVQGEAGRRSVAFAHFQHSAEGSRKRDELRTFSWDSRENHFYYLKNLQLEKLAWPRNEGDHDQWRTQWRSAFPAYSRHGAKIQDSKTLAGAMAKQAQEIRELVEDLYRLEQQGDALHKLMDRFRRDLISDLTPEAFADMVAQTVTYGLFAAAAQNEQTPSVSAGTDDEAPISYRQIIDSIPNTNPFLKELLTALVDEGHIDLTEVGMERLVLLLRNAHVPQITQDFMRQTGSGSEDPVVHFYEQFLNEYDRQQRVERGVFYTPDPVVDYMVRAVDQILQDEFGIAEGLASAEQEPTTGEHRVQILDPATGTGTFLAHIIDLIAQRKGAGDTPAWNAYVSDHLLPRLNGFELMMAPYTIAHMKLGLKLQQTGYRFESDERLRVYLTNALDGALGGQIDMNSFLVREAYNASSVKRHTPIMVVTGNPPYSISSHNKSNWIEHLMEAYKEDVRGEKNLQPLSDDYIKFLRFAHEKIKRTGKGIVAFITNREYILGQIHRGVRHKLIEDFSQIYILDLHGQVGELLPSGVSDKNVFDIQKGVAIVFLVANKSIAEAKVLHKDLYGDRDTKHLWLLSHSIHDVDWNHLSPKPDKYFFVPTNDEYIDEYEVYSRVHDIYSLEPATGFATHRDSFVFDFDLTNLQQRIEEFLSLDISDDEIRDKYGLNDTRDWSLSKARDELRKQNSIESTYMLSSYRPFDNRYIIYNESVIEYTRRDKQRHLLLPNIALITSKIAKNETYAHVFATRLTLEKIFLSPKSSNKAYIFSLYIYGEENTIENRDPNRQFELLSITENSSWAATDQGRRPNLHPAFVNECAGKLNLDFITDGRGDLVHTFGPEDIFHYAYAVFHSPTYRTRYAEFLKIDFPRLPLTNDLFLFTKLVHLGADLVALHLLEDDYAAASWKREGEESPLTQTGVTFVARENGTTVGAMNRSKAYDPATRRVTLDTSRIESSSYFAGVPEEVWDFYIGGYQVCHKWLYDRRAQNGEPGRTLTPEEIAHYTRVIVALRETMTLMDNIDAVIDKHGGWPLVGSQPTEAESSAPSQPHAVQPGQATGVETTGTENMLQNALFQEYEDEQPAEPAKELTTALIEKALQGETGVEYEGEDPAGDSREITPFDPTLIRIDNKLLTVDLIMRRIKEGEINLNPDFQRMGGIWNDVAQSRLIESILLRIPLPAFYMDASDDEQWLVIDGLQRLTALSRFILEGTLKLQKLEFWGNEYNGKTFQQLPRALQRRIEETQLTIYQIQSGTPHKVKFNIFKRINTGGVPLSGQEIRHALNLGPSTDLLKELANTLEFQRATDGSVSPMRMTDRECVLRFLAFKLKSYSEYTSRDDLDSFLNDRMQEINQQGKADPPSLETLRNAFRRAMDAAYNILGNRAFRKIDPKSNRRSPISKALFEVWAVNLDKLSDDELATLTNKRTELFDAFKELMDDNDFMVAISYSTGDPRRVRYRFSRIEQIIQETLYA